MSDVTVKLNWDGGLRFTATNAGGLETVFDGNKQSAASPVEILLEAVGACTGIDVILIMEKMRQPLQKLEVALDGDRNGADPRYFTAMRVRFDAWGDGIQADKLNRAISLSFAKYCSVYHSLRGDIKLQAEFRIHEVGAQGSGQYRVAENATPSGE